MTAAEVAANRRENMSAPLGKFTHSMCAVEGSAVKTLLMPGRNVQFPTGLNVSGRYPKWLVISPSLVLTVIHSLIASPPQCFVLLATSPGPSAARMRDHSDGTVGAAAAARSRSSACRSA